MDESKKIEIVERMMAKKLAELERDYQDTINATRHEEKQTSDTEEEEDIHEQNEYQTVDGFSDNVTDANNIDNNDSFEETEFKSARHFTTNTNIDSSMPTITPISNTSNNNSESDFEVDWNEMKTSDNITSTANTSKNTNKKKKKKKKKKNKKTNTNPQSSSSTTSVISPPPMTPEKIATIKNLMSSIKLKPPPWAINTPEEVWMDKILKGVSPSPIPSTIPSTKANTNKSVNGGMNPKKH